MTLLVGGITNKVVTAYEEKSYAGLSNRVTISDDDGDRVAYIRPPSWIFNFATSVARTHPKNLAFYLEQGDSNKWFFGVDDLTRDWNVDLIQWRRSELPYWASQEYQDNLRDGTECPLPPIPKGQKTKT